MCDVLALRTHEAWYTPHAETVAVADIAPPFPGDVVLRHRLITLPPAAGSGVFGFQARQLPPGEMYTATAMIYLPEEFDGRGVALVMSGDPSLSQISADPARRHLWQRIAVSVRLPPTRSHAAPAICILAGRTPLTIYSSRWEIFPGPLPARWAVVRNELRHQGTSALAKCFESLGNNCELGIVQRANGYDTPGLFRNTGFLHIAQIIHALESHFAGMFESGRFDYIIRGGWPDYALHCRQHGFVFHTGISCEQPLSAEICARNVAAFQFMLQKLRRDLDLGEKIFVYRSEQPIPDSEIARLHAAIRAYGPGWLLYVREDRAAPRAGVVLHSPGLLVATVPQLSNSNPPDIDMPAWDRVASMAVGLHESATARPPERAQA